MERIKRMFGFRSKPKFSDGPISFKEMEHAATRRISTIVSEFSKTFRLMRGYRRSVTIFGSAQFNENNEHYIKARRLSQRIAKELRYAITTGGGPGIMEGANRGAYEAGGQSIGMNIRLPNFQHLNKYLTAHINFNFFFTRKVALSFSSETYIFFPGGFGTLDEFFEIIMLIQTRKIPPVPVVCVGKEFWEKIDEYFKKELLEKYKTISPADINIYKITDNDDEIIDIIRKAPLRRE